MKNNINQIRSLLVVPSISENNLNKIFSLKGIHKPDAIIFDLEDSVSSQYKDKALTNLEHFYTKNKQEITSNYTTVIRINAKPTKQYDNDISLVKELRPDFIGPSKVNSPDEILEAKKLSGVGNVFVPIETITAAINYKDIINCLNREDGMLIGYEDLSSEFMIKRPPLEKPGLINTVIIQSLLYAKHKRVAFFDAVYAGYKTEEHLTNLRKEARYTKSLGIAGKVCIHPSQISIVNDVYDKEREKEEAKLILSQLDNASPKSVKGFKGEMIGPPMEKYYKKFLDVN